MMVRNAAFFQEHQQRVWQAHDVSRQRGNSAPIAVLFDLSDPAARRVARQFGVDDPAQARARTAARREGWSPMAILTTTFDQAQRVLAKHAPNAATNLCASVSPNIMAVVTVGA